MSEDNIVSNADILRMSQNMEQYGIGLLIKAGPKPAPTSAVFTTPSTVKTLEQVSEELTYEREHGHPKPAYVAPIVNVLLGKTSLSSPNTTTPSASLGSRMMGSVMGLLSYATPSYFRRQ